MMRKTCPPGWLSSTGLLGWLGEGYQAIPYVVDSGDKSSGTFSGCGRTGLDMACLRRFPGRSRGDWRLGKGAHEDHKRCSCDFAGL